MTTAAILHDHKLEKQMGCMTIFFQMFEKNQIMTRRINSTKRLHSSSSSVVISAPELVKTVTPPAVTEEREMEKPLLTRTGSPSSDRFRSSPAREVRSMPVSVPAKVLATSSSFEFKPRLSLDSRAIMDSKGSLQPRDIRTKLAILSRNPSDSSENGTVSDTDDNPRRSPSVIARLMGLELLPSCPEATKKSELRRSASESRVTRDLLQCQFADVNTKQRNNHQTPISLKQLNAASPSNVANTNSQTLMRNSARGIYGGGSQWRPHLQRRSFYDSDDSFPEPKQTSDVYAEIEKRLKMKGIDDPSKDLDTLKQLLEAIQLKGLLHSNNGAGKQTSDITRQRNNNFVYDRSFPPDKMQQQPRFYRGSSSTNPTPHHRQQAAEIEYQPRIRTRKESYAKAPIPIGGKRQSAIAITKKSNSNINEQRRAVVSSPVQSPVQSPRSKNATDLLQKNRRQITASPQTSDSERKKLKTPTPTTEESGGKNLLERCDKLLNSIAKMTAKSAAVAADDSQPSPVSVLQYKEEVATPSPVLKRCIDFKDHQQQKGLEYVDDEYNNNIINSSPVDIISSPRPIEYNYYSVEPEPEPELVYIADVFAAITSINLPEDADVFLMVEEQYNINDGSSSKISKLDRMVIFDLIIEILVRNNRPLPPWKAAVAPACLPPSVEQIWAELQNIQRKPPAQDVVVDDKKEKESSSTSKAAAAKKKEKDLARAMILGVVRKEFGKDEIKGWGEEPTEELAEMVLDIERLIFKDLISETIQELASISVTKNLPLSSS